jgi:hypothetical protein
MPYPALKTFMSCGAALKTFFRDGVPYPALRIFFRDDVPGTWCPMPPDVADKLAAGFQRDPNAAEVAADFSHGTRALTLVANCNGRCRLMPQDAPPAGANVVLPDVDVVYVTAYWTYKSKGVMVYYDEQTACELEFSFKKMLEHNCSSSTVTVGPYRMHLSATGGMIQERTDGKGTQCDVLRTDIVIAAPPEVHTYDGVVVKATETTEALPSGIPNDPSDFPAATMQAAGVAVAFVTRIHLHYINKVVNKAEFELADKRGRPVANVHAKGKSLMVCPVDPTVKYVTIHVGQLVYPYVRALQYTLAQLWTSTDLLNWLGDNIEAVLSIASLMTVAAVLGRAPAFVLTRAPCLALAAPFAVPLGLISLGLTVAWSGQWRTPTMRQVHRLLGVTWTMSHAAVRSQTLKRAKELTTPPVKNAAVSAWHAQSLLCALQIYEEHYGVLSHMLEPPSKQIP